MIIENSKIPEIISKVAPVDIDAITLYPFIFCKGKARETLKRHEAIHLRQQKELFIIPFYFLYAAMWIIGFIKYRDGAVAYKRIPFEQEAYSNYINESYLDNRPCFEWRKYKI